VLILQRIDQIVEVLDVVGPRICQCVRVKLPERLVDSFEVKCLILRLSAHLRPFLIDDLELLLPNFIVDHELWVVVPEEGFENSNFSVFTSEPFGLKGRHHQKLYEVIVQNFSQIDLPGENIPPESDFQLVHH